MSLSSEESASALATLIATIEALAGAHTTQAVGEVVRSAARRLTGADGVAVVLKEGDKVHYIDEDAVGPLWKGGVFPIDCCISGWAILNRQTVVISDVFKDDRIPKALYAPTFVKSLIMAPVRPHDPIAAVGAYWAEVREPTAREIAALETIARATAVALDNVGLRASLEQALLRAESSNRAKSDFLTNMSHEVRTPLNGLLGAADMLARTAQTPGQGELMEVMRASASDFERVMSDVLDFARMQSDDVAVTSGLFHLGETVRDVARLFELRLMAKQVTFHIEIAPEADRMVRGDRLRVKQVLNNLVSNAVKFTAVGSVTLSVARTGDGAMRLAVADTGVGFAHKDKERMFAGFEQGDGSATRAYGGTGLGLAISRRLVLMMDGRLEAADNPGGGALFECILPLPETETERPADVMADEPDAPVERRIRVLIVDDHPVNRKVAELMLAQVGADIVEAVNGEEACQAFKAEPFDLILMDIQMPVMDGLTATRQIRTLEAERGQGRTPILMVTANALPEHVVASHAAGADRHLPKPLQIDKLFEAMNETMAEEAA